MSAPIAFEKHMVYTHRLQHPYTQTLIHSLSIERDSVGHLERVELYLLTVCCESIGRMQFENGHMQTAAVSYRTYFVVSPSGSKPRLVSRFQVWNLNQGLPISLLLFALSSPLLLSLVPRGGSLNVYDNQ